MLRSLFIGLSESKRLRRFAEQSPLGLRFSSRFVAGTQLDDVIRATQVVNEWGAGVSIDNLGENVTNADESKHSAELYHRMLDEISSRKLNANISLKLTHMGFDVSEDLAFGLLAERIRIRLCKGAYKEPPDIAFPKKAEVDANYLKLAHTLLKSGVFHGI